MAEPDNVGGQFRPIARQMLLDGIHDHLDAIKKITAPAAGQVFGQDLSDREMLDHPSVQADNNLYHAKHHMTYAQDASTNGDTMGVLNSTAQGGKHLVEAVKAATESPHITDADKGAIVNHMTDALGKINSVHRLVMEELS